MRKLVFAPTTWAMKKEYSNISSDEFSDCKQYSIQS